MKKPSEIMNQIEAVLFASGDPVSCDRLGLCLGVPSAVAREQALELKALYDERGGALQVLLLEDRFQLCSRSQYAQPVRAALELHRNTPLSQAAMEVLAVIAYHQPATRAFIEQVRGVDSSRVVNTLVERQLIEEAGRLDLPGRPIGYRTTDLFLRSFGVSSLEQLPPLPAPEKPSAMEPFLDEAQSSGAALTSQNADLGQITAEILPEKGEEQP